MLVYRTNKYKLYLNQKDKNKIKNIFECVTIVKEKYLNDLKNGVDLNRQCKDILEDYRKDDERLRKCETSPLMNALFEVNDLKRRKVNIGKISEQNRFRITNFNNIIYFNKDYVHLPSVGNLKIYYYRKIPSKSKIYKIEITKNKIGNYYIYVMYDLEVETNNGLDIRKSVGIDYSQNDLIVTSDGYKDEANMFYQVNEKRLATIRSELSKTTNKEDRIKLIKKIRRINNKIKNQRRDKLQKLSTNLVNKYDYIFIEDLNMLQLTKNKHFGKKAYDNAYGIFRSYLEYKTKEKGKKLIVVDKYFPSSKKCNYCGSINNELQLWDREWTCKCCGNKHDRDLNAAINILNEGKRLVKNM